MFVADVSRKHVRFNDEVQVRCADGDTTEPLQTIPPPSITKLPDNWSKEFSKTQKQVYYFNRKTNQRIYHDPATKSGKAEMNEDKSTAPTGSYE